MRKNYIRMFKVAIDGLLFFFRKEHNASIHLVASLVVICLGFFYRVDRSEWIWIVFAIALVFGAELFNSAIERLSDLVHAEQHPEIKKIKDLSAASVLIASLAAVIIGLILFIPYFMS